jgi:hypothetical protein
MLWLAFVVAGVTLVLFLRHRQAEVTDSSWLRDYERARWLADSPEDKGGWWPESVHGEAWQTRRDKQDVGGSPFDWIVTVKPRTKGRGKLKAFRVWAWALAVFAIVDLLAALASMVGLLDRFVVTNACI